MISMEGSSTVAGLGSRRQQRFAVAALMVLLAAVGVEYARGEANGSFCESLVRPYGYPCTEYTVQTEDGYLLGVQNIPQGVSKASSVLGEQRAPVFLQNGIFGGGDQWVFNGPSESLAFLLADAGFDVWIGNIRGIEWSYGHVELTPDEPEFWNWSLDELAAYDLPAMLGFVNQQTGSKLMYVGHSQGTTMVMAGLVGTAQSTNIANMLGGVVMLSPVAFMGNITSEFIKVAADLYIDEMLDLFGVREFNVMNEVGVKLIQDVCGTSGVNCSNLLEAVTGKDCCLNWTRLPYYLNFFPEPTSTKNLAHFAQMIRTNTFTKYDYGTLYNLVHYGQTTPPAYNFTNMPGSVPSMVVSGGQDDLADPTDVDSLLSILTSQVKKTVFLEAYSHSDFVASQSANVDVYPQVIQFLQNSTAS